VPPVDQQPQYQQPARQMPAPAAPARDMAGYDEGYAAGLAAHAQRRSTATSHRVTTTRSRGVSSRSHVTRPKAVARHAPVTRPQAHRRVVTTSTVVRHANTVPRFYQDTIKDRAATYRPPVYGPSTSLASIMSPYSSYGVSTITWSGPASVVNQGGQVCGWGARIVTNAHGQAQRQAVWVCQCPQGWRPPGY
jgi:hypothetical protein